VFRENRRRAEAIAEPQRFRAANRKAEAAHSQPGYRANVAQLSKQRKAIRKAVAIQRLQRLRAADRKTEESDATSCLTVNTMTIKMMFLLKHTKNIQRFYYCD
jgi:hypothetical protein